MRTLTKEMLNAITPGIALNLLKDGNKRFVNNLKFNRDLLQQVNETSSGQNPFAVIISCMDSRTSAELIFDQGLGDIFSIRIAGNIVNNEIIGSTEFGCKVVGSKIVVIVGHTGCGAIKGAVGNVELGHLHTVTSKIQRCIPDIKSKFTAISDDELVNRVTRENIKLGIQDLRAQSPILEKMVQNKEILIVGALYDISSGEVEFFE